MLNVSNVTSDLKGMSKIVSGILILRKGQSPDWTTELDDAMNSWAREYITWLETAKIAIEEALATKYVMLFANVTLVCAKDGPQQSRNVLLQPACCAQGLGQ